MSEGQAAPLDFDQVVRETSAHIRAYIAGLGVPRSDVDDVAMVSRKLVDECR